MPFFFLVNTLIRIITAERSKVLLAGSEGLALIMSTQAIGRDKNKASGIRLHQMNSYDKKMSYPCCFMIRFPMIKSDWRSSLEYVTAKFKLIH